MVWVIILVLLVASATLHARRVVPHPARGRVTEIFLVYLLAGYYGVAMLLAAVVHFLNPVGIANLKGWQPSEPFQTLYLARAYRRTIQHGVEQGVGADET